jgi:hypothetical protein
MSNQLNQTVPNVTKYSYTGNVTTYVGNYIAYSDDIITTNVPTNVSTTNILKYSYDNIITTNILSYSYDNINDIINIPTVNILSYIQTVGDKIIPKNSEDAITFEQINDSDILIDFKRTNTKTEYDFGAFYKQSTLEYILKSNKNQFTLESIDINSIVKYVARLE